MASAFRHPGLEKMGYHFNDKLELRQIENGEPFKWQGQLHYDVLVRAIHPFLILFSAIPTD